MRLLNRFGVVSAGLLLLLVFAVPGEARAALLTAEVVQKDTLLASTTLPDSNPDTERDWVFGVLEAQLVDTSDLEYTKIDPGSGGAFWVKVDDQTDWYAFDFGTLEPLYFMVKTGGGQIDGNWLYENLEALRYGVIALSDFGDFQGLEIGVVSHIGYVDGGNGGEDTQVPEPASLLLFGLGAFAAGYRARRTFRV
jgi:hypothetical protein